MMQLLIQGLRKEYAAIDKALDLAKDSNLKFSIINGAYVALRNIALGIEDLTKRWVSSQTLYGSMADTFEDYDEVWRTPGYQDKAIRSVYEDMAEVQKAEAEEEILAQYNHD